MVTKVFFVGIQISRQKLWNCKDDFERKNKWKLCGVSYFSCISSQLEIRSENSEKLAANLARNNKAKRARKNRNQQLISHWDFPPAIFNKFPSIFSKDTKKLEDFKKLKPFQIKKHKLVQKTRKWLSKHNFLEKYLHFKTDKKCFLILFFCLFTARQKVRKKSKIIFSILGYKLLFDDEEI